MPDWTVVILAALIGAGSSIAGTALTMAWSSRQQSDQSARDEAATIRAEKRTAYRDVIQSVDAWRDAAADIANAGPSPERWATFWAARDGCLRSAAMLQLLGTDAMIDAASEASEALLGIAEARHWADGVVYSDVWTHVTVADRELDRMLGIMRADLGIAPLEEPRPVAAPIDTGP